MKQNVQQKKCKCILGLKAHPSSVVNHECFLPGNLIYPSQIYLAPRILTWETGVAIGKKLQYWTIITRLV